MTQIVMGTKGLAAPPVTARIGETALRSAAVLAGIVVRVEAVRWVGGQVLEVQLRDVSGSIGLAFLGRRQIGGIEPGAFVTVAGTVGQRDGVRVVLNPRYWLEGQDPRHADDRDVELAAPAGAGAATGRLPHHG